VAIRSKCSWLVGSGAGFAVEQAIYVDMNTNSLREVDVVAFSRRAMSF